MKYLSRESAIDTAKQIFSRTQGDSVTPREAAVAWGREAMSEKDNRRWLDNKMIHLKYHNLIMPVYSRRNSRRVLDRIQLTLDGKRAIGRIETTKDDTHKSLQLLSDLTKQVAKFRQDNPDYQIIFEVKLKEVKEVA